jgi:hypothetical protein
LHRRAGGLDSPMPQESVPECVACRADSRPSNRAFRLAKPVSDRSAKTRKLLLLYRCAHSGCASISRVQTSSTRPAQKLSSHNVWGRAGKNTWLWIQPYRRFAKLQPGNAGFGPDHRGHMCGPKILCHMLVGLLSNPGITHFGVRRCSSTSTSTSARRSPLVSSNTLVYLHHK